KWTDVDLSAGVIRVPNAQKGIGVPWREVPITSGLDQLFAKWRQEDEQAGAKYIVHYNGKPVKRVKTSWQHALKRAGIDCYIRPYDLRHGFATEAIASGTDYGTVSSLMGHKSPVMVLRHYQHVNNRQKVKAMENLVQPGLIASLV
ncbi:MAG: tyrosine-type recombinase/integrase, partial [Desulfovibrio sp.]|nr:tyrosine-type recombinase/integrase [Desulfovibrio sp.]